MYWTVRKKRYQVPNFGHANLYNHILNIGIFVYMHMRKKYQILKMKRPYTVVPCNENEKLESLGRLCFSLRRCISLHSSLGPKFFSLHFHFDPIFCKLSKKPIFLFSPNRSEDVSFSLKTVEFA